MMRALTMATVLAFPTGAAAQATGPTDPQIAHIAYTAGEIDIAAARQALAKSTSKQVREFAESMVRDHVAVNEKALSLVKELGVTPEANPTSTTLGAQGARKLAELAKLNGRAFDRAYVQNEVTYHQTVNDALRTTLIPHADNARLRGLLETGLKLFQEHQLHAEQVAKAIDGHDGGSTSHGAHAAPATPRPGY